VGSRWINLITDQEWVCLDNSLGAAVWKKTTILDHTAFSNIDTNTHAQIDTHLASNSNPHSVTKVQVGLSNVENILDNLGATGSPGSTDDNSQGYAVGSRWFDTTSDEEWVCLDATASIAVWKNTTLLDHTALTNSGTYTHNQIDNHLNDGTIHFTKTSISHNDLQDKGTNSHSQIDTHIVDVSLHFIEASIDHTSIQNVGTNTHAQIDTHLADTTTHFTEASIDHQNLQNIGTNTHVQIDTHLADATTHFTEASIDHQNLQNVGTNTHAQIDSHLANSSLHRTINDGNTGSNDLWSASKINSELGTKSNPGHTHTSGEITDFNSAADARITVQKGAANDLATLDGSSKIPTSQLPVLAITDVFVVTDIGTRDALTPQAGDVCKVTDAGSGFPGTYIYDGNTWIDIQESSDVISISGKTGVVVLDTDDVLEGGNLYYTEGRVSANTDVTNATAHLTNSSNPHSFTKAQVGLSNVANLKVKLDATANPTVNDDSSNGYAVGSRWINVNADREWVCLDASNTAAVWTETTVADHINLQNVGTNTHAQIDSHIADATLHFTEASIDHTNLQNIGTNTHAQIDSHLADATLHFTEANIDHQNLQNIGTNTHAQIDTHLASSANPHSVVKIRSFCNIARVQSD